MTQAGGHRLLFPKVLVKVAFRCSAVRDDGSRCQGGRALLLKGHPKVLWLDRAPLLCHQNPARRRK